MTIGRNSRKSSVRSSIRAPKFLDKSSGFYGRLDEPETTAEEVKGDVVENDDSRETGVEINPSLNVVHISGVDEEVEVFSGGMMEDDGETLLRRKPGRYSSRWRRSTRRKQKDEEQNQDKGPSLGTQNLADAPMLEDKIKELKNMEEENQKAGIMKEPALVHFQVQEFADDWVLIRDKKRGREEETEEDRKTMKEQEEGMKMVKRSTVRNYRKAFDRALRRGWEVFITNLYSVTLTPVTSPPSSSSSLKKKHQHSSVLADFR